MQITDNTLQQGQIVYHNLVERPWTANLLRFALTLGSALQATAVAGAGIYALCWSVVQLKYLHAGKELCATSYVMSRAEICAAQGRYAHPDCMIRVSHAERVYDFKAGLCPGWSNPT